MLAFNGTGVRDVEARKALPVDRGPSTDDTDNVVVWLGARLPTTALLSEPNEFWSFRVGSCATSPFSDLGESIEVAVGDDVSCCAGFCC